MRVVDAVVVVVTTVRAALLALVTVHLRIHSLERVLIPNHYETQTGGINGRNNDNDLVERAN